MKVVVSILTYNRPAELIALLDDLEREAAQLDGELAVRIYDDHSDDWVPVARLATRRGYHYWRSAGNYGKVEHWRFVKRELADLRNVEADWYVFLPDDCRLVSGFFARAFAIWEKLEQPAALTLAAQAERLGACWTRFRPRQGAGWCEIGWIDGLYICRRRFLELLRFTIDEPLRAKRARRYAQRRGRRHQAPGHFALLGSGVGKEMSIRALARGARLYRVDDSLVELLPVPSLMNPQARVRDPLLSIRLAAEVSHD